MISNILFVFFLLALNAKAFTISCAPRISNGRQESCTHIHCRRARTHQGFPLLQSTVSRSSASSTSIDQEDLIRSLLEQTREEADGTKLPSSQREAINSIVQNLEDITSQDESLDMTSIPLEGKHRLIYIDSERTPQYIGPFKGTTTQYFINDEEFQNRLSLGPIQIALTALRQRMDGYRMKVKFQSFGVNIFGSEVVKKELKQQGVWKMVFVGEVDDSSESASRTSVQQETKRKILLRVMRTPSLYILAKDL
jgi:hypothetical protein